MFIMTTFYPTFWPLIYEVNISHEVCFYVIRSDLEMILLTMKFVLKMRLPWSNLRHSSWVSIYPVPSIWYRATLPRGQWPLPNCGLNLWGTEFLSGFFSLSFLPSAENFILKRVQDIIITNIYPGTVLNVTGTLVHLLLTAVLWGEYSVISILCWGHWGTGRTNTLPRATQLFVW